jgi:hypothetical protein
LHQRKGNNAEIIVFRASFLKDKFKMAKIFGVPTVLLGLIKKKTEIRVRSKEVPNGMKGVFECLSQKTVGATNFYLVWLE